MANKKPAPKGGKKNAAPKKVAKRKPIPQQVTEKAIRDRQSKADFTAAKSGALAYADDRSGWKGMVGPVGSDFPIEQLPAHPTVEEQYSAEERRRMDAANGLARRVEREMAAHRHSLENPSLLRRAWNGVKRAFRFRSAKTGEYVTKQYAEANPDTTVREKA